ELALLTLYRPETGAPVAQLEATELTWMRTGAVSAIGARHLARPASRTLCHIGARGTARYNLRYLDHLFDFATIRITSRRPESRERFAAEMTGRSASRWSPSRRCGRPRRVPTSSSTLRASPASRRCSRPSGSAPELW